MLRLVGQTPRNLCARAGPQSSEPHILWCFRERGDMNGVLDGDNDLLPQINPALGRPHAWYKTTIAESADRVGGQLLQRRLDRHLLLVVRGRLPPYLGLSVSGKPYGCARDYGPRPAPAVRLRRFHFAWCFRPRAGDFFPLREPSGATESYAAQHLTLADLSLGRRHALVAEAARANLPMPSGENGAPRTMRGETLAQTLLLMPAGRSSGACQADLEWLDGEFARQPPVRLSLARGPAAAASQPARGEAPSFQGGPGVTSGRRTGNRSCWVAGFGSNRPTGGRSSGAFRPSDARRTDFLP